MLECINPKASKLITSSLKIPTIGIGSSNNCDGQILVTDDMLGISGFYPKFVKKYLSLDRIIEKAIKGMLPKNKLGANLFRNLHVYQDNEHKHIAQNPKLIDLSKF